MTKTRYLEVYRQLLLENASWAKNVDGTEHDQLKKFMKSVENSIRTDFTTWACDSRYAKKAWKDIGQTGRMSLKALRALPD